MVILNKSHESSDNVRTNNRRAMFDDTQTKPQFFVKCAKIRCVSGAGDAEGVRGVWSQETVELAQHRDERFCVERQGECPTTVVLEYLWQGLRQ